MGMIDDSRESVPMSREEIVETLKTMVFGPQAFKRFNAKERESLDYAIFSLKTDKAYQLMYEGEDVYTKADMVAMLTELHTEIEELPMYYDPLDISDLIQQKIDMLKEKEN